MLKTVDELYSSLLNEGVQKVIVDDPGFKTYISNIMGKKGFDGIEIEKVLSDSSFVLNVFFDGIISRKKLFGFTKETDNSNNQDTLYIGRVSKRDVKERMALDPTENSDYMPFGPVHKITLSGQTKQK